MGEGIPRTRGIDSGTAKRAAARTHFRVSTVVTKPVVGVTETCGIADRAAAGATADPLRCAALAAAELLSRVARRTSCHRHEAIGRREVVVEGGLSVLSELAHGCATAVCGTAVSPTRTDVVDVDVRCLKDGCGSAISRAGVND